MAETAAGAAAGRWIQTYASAAPIYPLALTPDMVHIEDIAHALAMKCRWTGHTHTFYSVAQHSVHVSELVPREAALAALLHDAAEAYLPDIAAPIKAQICVRVDGVVLPFARMEEEVLDAVWQRFDVEIPNDRVADEIRYADLVMLATEARDLMHGTGDWTWSPPPPRMERITCWTPGVAKARFLARFHSLCATLKEGTR